MENLVIELLPIAANRTATASLPVPYPAKGAIFIPVTTNNSFLLKFGKL